VHKEQLLPDTVVISELTGRTIPSKFYIPPKPHQVDAQLRLNKFQPKAWDVLADVINLLSPGEYTAHDGDVIEAEDWAQKHPLQPNKDGEWTIDNRYKTKDAMEAHKDRVRQRLHYHSNVRSFLIRLEEIFGLESLPGSSPLQKSITLIRMLEEGKKNNRFFDPTQPGFTPQALAVQIAEAVKKARNATDSETQLLGHGGMCSGEDGETGGGGDKSPELIVAAIATDMMSGKATIMAVARHLSSLSRMTVGRSYEKVPDPEGRILDPRRIQDFDEMHRLSTTEWAYPDYFRNYRIITQQARVYTPAVERSKKQGIYMIVDCSGSMGGMKTFIAGGCIMRGLRGVMDDDAELFLRLFDTELKPELEARNPQQALEAMQWVLGGNFSGGGTQIAHCAPKARDRMRELAKDHELAKLELVIVTDGDDDTSCLHADQFAGMKVHTILVHPDEDDQEELLQLSRSTGGVGIRIPAGTF
jgi:hypothetical protein